MTTAALHSRPRFITDVESNQRINNRSRPKALLTGPMTAPAATVATPTQLFPLSSPAVLGIIVNTGFTIKDNGATVYAAGTYDIEVETPTAGFVPHILLNGTIDNVMVAQPYTPTAGAPIRYKLTLTNLTSGIIIALTNVSTSVATVNFLRISPLTYV
jgi:hypothetical protein